MKEKPRKKLPGSFKYGKLDSGGMSKMRACLPTQNSIVATDSCHQTTLVEQGYPGSLDWQTGNGETTVERGKVSTPRFNRNSTTDGGKARSVQESGLRGDWRGSRKAVTLSTETLTYFWLVYQWMENCAANTTSPDLLDTVGAAQKTDRERDSALPQGFIQQSDQNNLSEREAGLKGQGRTLMAAGSNDNLITEIEFTKAHSELIIIITNLIYIVQFDTNGILTALYIVITYIQMQYVHVWTYMKQSYKYTYTCLNISKYIVTCTNIYLPTY